MIDATALITPAILARAETCLGSPAKMNSDFLYLDNDNLAVIRGAKDSITREPITQATGTWALKTAAGLAVAAGDLEHWGCGSWFGAIPAATPLAEGQIYHVFLALTDDDGRKYSSRLVRKAKHRGNA